MIFDSPVLLLLAPLLGVMVGLLTWAGRHRRIHLAGSWSPELRNQARSNGRFGPLWLGIVAVLLGVALAGPRGGRTEITTETRALSLVMVMDVSRSMLAEDVAPSRLGRAVREARRLVYDLPGDRVGLIAFAGRSYILSPLTIDGGAITLQLDALGPDLASQGGTSLAAALAQGAQLLGASTEISDRVLVVFTDGEAHDSLDAIVQSAEHIRDEGIRLVLAAEGTPLPSRIPIRDSAGTLIEYQRTRSGEVVETSREDGTLRQVADASDGTIIPADVPDQAGAIRDLTAAFKRNPSTETRTADLMPLAWIPLLLAALVLLGQTVSRSTASLVGLGALLLGPADSSAQLITEAERAVRDSALGRASGAYLDLARAGFARDTSFYNAGTSAMMAGELEAATVPLTQASRSLDPELRFRALYNLGTAALKTSRVDTARAAALREVAVRHLKEALMLQPGSADAKWNLELALRPEPPPSDGGGGGGQGAPPPPSGQEDQPEADPQPVPDGLSQSQAEQILNSVEREERATRSNQQKRRRGRGAGGGKDW